MASRNRILYQSEALYAGVSTGQHGVAYLATQLNRVQDISHDLDINRTDIFEFGQLAPIARQVVDAPVVSLDFSYLLADGANERKMGLNLADTANATAWTNGTWGNAISGILDNAGKKERNYYVVTTREYLDVNAPAGGDAPVGGNCTVVGFGNGALSNYVVNAAVGDLPTANVSVEAYNCRFVKAGAVNNAVAPQTAWISGFAPTVNKVTSTGLNDVFVLPSGSTGDLEVFSLRPGDITVAFDSGVSSLQNQADAANNLQIGGAILPTGDPDGASTTDGETPIQLQNFSIELPLARTPLNRIGTTFPYDRAVDFPLDMTFNMSAFLADVSEGQLVDLMCESQDTRDVTINCKFPCGRKDSIATNQDTNMEFKIKNVYLQSQNFGATIGDNKTVDLSFTAQFGGVSDTSNGLFISGIDATDTPDGGVVALS